MNIKAPTQAQYPQLKHLWQQAFGDPMAFIDGFFATGFSPERCRCLTLEGQVAAALYWFDAHKSGNKFAYIYAVATEKAHRGKGLCRALMEDTHRHLAHRGYCGALLVPAEAHLWDYYGSMGYQRFGTIRSFTADAAATPVALTELSPAEYLHARSDYLPSHTLQETQAVAFYATWGKFYRGENLLLAAATDDTLCYVQEYLGDPQKAGGVVAALGGLRGRFRTPGGQDSCAMRLMFSPVTPPEYLGFPLD